MPLAEAINKALEMKPSNYQSPSQTHDVRM